jgi:crotonobetainyl-CoA:carnitine CoA-transferase CaiB-like acyl-CoA transferase
VRAAGLLSQEEHPVEGKTFAISSTIKFDQEYPPLGAPAKARGADTKSILSDLGMTEEEITHLMMESAALNPSTPL